MDFYEYLNENIKRAKPCSKIIRANDDLSRLEKMGFDVSLFRNLIDSIRIAIRTAGLPENAVIMQFNPQTMEFKLKPEITDIIKGDQLCSEMFSKFNPRSKINAKRFTFKF